MRFVMENLTFVGCEEFQTEGQGERGYKLYFKMLLGNSLVCECFKLYILLIVDVHF